MVGVDVRDAFLQGVDLNGANLLRANFRFADIRDGSFVGLGSAPSHDAMLSAFTAAFVLLCIFHGLLIAAAVRLPLSV